MIDERQRFEEAFELFARPEPAWERLVRRRDHKRRNQRVAAGILGIAVFALAAVGFVRLLGSERAPVIGPAASPSPSPMPSPSPSENPSPTPSIWSPVREGTSAVHSAGTWRDPHDAPVGWVDVTSTRFYYAFGQPNWTIELAAKPPPAADRERGLLIAYGLVLDTTGDGVADYVIGIDNDAPKRGDFHIWVTDLATGKTDEQVGPPYGFPIEFSHPDEPPRKPLMYFTFLPGSAPADFDHRTVRFYAWASAARGGEVFATDYVPDRGWITTP